MNTKEIQKQFFTHIQQQIVPRNLIDELSELLNVAPSSVYRRINGETFISVEDLTKILQQYPFISYEKLIRPNHVTYNFATTTTSTYTMSDYLNNMERDLQKIRAFPDAQITYAAQELPFFHYLLVPELAAFKFYVWSRTIWLSNTYLQEQFDLSKYYQNTELHTQITRVAQLYNAINSHEIWNSNMLDMTLNQIRHSFHSGHFKHQEDVHEIFKGLRMLIAQLHKMVALGQKRMENGLQNTVATLQVWYNELIHNSSFILVQLTANQRIVYNVLDAPNFMNSADKVLYQYYQDFLDKIRSYALPLCGGINERHSELFFHRLEQKVKFLEDELSIKSVRF